MKDLPPLITFQSVMDFTVSTRAIITSLYAHLPANGDVTVEVEPHEYLGADLEQQFLDMRVEQESLPGGPATGVARTAGGGDHVRRCPALAGGPS